MTMTVAAPWNPVHASFRMTGTSTKPVPVQQLRILYSKYGTRNNRVKSLMWATRNRVHMLSPLMLLPLYYDIPVSAKRLQRARTEKAPGEGHAGNDRGGTRWIPACAAKAPLALKRNARGGKDGEKGSAVSSSPRRNVIPEYFCRGRGPMRRGRTGFPPGAALPVNSQDLVLEELPR